MVIPLIGERGPSPVFSEDPAGHRIEIDLARLPAEHDLEYKDKIRSGDNFLHHLAMDIG